MKGSTSDEKVATIGLASEETEIPTVEIGSTLCESIEVEKGGAMEKNGSIDASEESDESGAKNNEHATNSKELDENENSEEMEEEEEQWELKKIMSIAAVARKSPIKCSHETCTLVAATVWVSNLKPSESWYSCLDCQVRQLRSSNIAAPMPNSEMMLQISLEGKRFRWMA